MELSGRTLHIISPRKTNKTANFAHVYQLSLQRLPSIEMEQEPKRMIGSDRSVTSRNWGDLHSSLLHCIYKKLHDTFDFISFRAVCKWWRAAAPLLDPPQLPIFLQRETYRSSEFKVYSLTGKTGRFQVPELDGKEFSGQSQGYLITYQFFNRDKPVALFNPFTRAERQLPFNGFQYFVPLHVGDNPLQNDSDLVIYMDRPGEQKFVRLQGEQYNEWHVGCACFSKVYYKGQIFYSEWNYNTNVIDLTTGTRSKVRFPYDDGRFNFLIEGHGTLFGIQQIFRSDLIYTQLENCWFDVYQLNEEEKPARWVKLSDIGDLSIFLNFNQGFCLSASGSSEIRGNCIYFSQWNSSRTQNLIGRYTLGEKGSEVIGKASSHGNWIVPKLSQ